MRVTRVCAILACLTAASDAREPAIWNSARSPHFEVFTDAGVETARSLALGLERLHSFFIRQIGLSPPPQRAVRVICFATQQEYSQHRTHSRADAYFIGTGDRDYIVMPASSPNGLRIAAHEYAHILIHSAGWKLPEWIAEGVSDVISTVRFGNRESLIGGELPDRSAALRHANWLPLADLFTLSLEKPELDANRTNLFYAESWAITDLLMFSPAYRAHFPVVLAALASGIPPERAFREAYGATPDTIERDARARLARGSQAIPIPSLLDRREILQAGTMNAFTVRAMLADLSAVNGDLPLAESLYQALASERPADAEIQAALGTVALRRGETTLAARAWKRAIDLGIADSALCFRYASLADTYGLPTRPALERAVALRPDFDDARYQLALLEKNAGNAAAAVAQLRAMRDVAPPRAFAWWSALADALLDLNLRSEAKHAANQAYAHAAGAGERERATQLEWMADTELAVEIDGLNYRAVRVPAGSARNPFIEPGDRPQRAEGALRDVQCNGDAIRLLIDTAQGPLTLGVPDPSRVQIRNAAAAAFEFTCGPRETRTVLVDYAAASMVLRALELR
jgi:tetratricopeptide (TPR) repeat protein